MCDFSLKHAKSRAAEKGDKLVTKNFGNITKGFAAKGDTDTAVCLLPGTEVGFKNEATFDAGSKVAGTTAKFVQLNIDNPHTHHDALEFSDGGRVYLTQLDEGQEAHVLQLPAMPTNEAERKAQMRIPVVA